MMLPVSVEVIMDSFGLTDMVRAFLYRQMVARAMNESTADAMELLEYGAAPRWDTPWDRYDEC